MCNWTPHKVYELVRGESYEPKSVNNNQTNKNKLIYALSGVLLKTWLLYQTWFFVSCIHAFLLALW